MTVAATNKASFERLTEDEVTFCWRSLADQGQLSVARLQQFMQEVSGERLTSVQAKDLLNYMDANGDGRVGMEDFRHFVSIGRLADTDPKSFMWAPKAKYREEHGLYKHHDEQRTPDHAHRPPEQQTIRAASTLFDLSRRFSLDSLGEAPMEEQTPQRPPRGGMVLEPELSSVDEMRSTRILPHNQHDPHAQTPSPLPGGQASLRQRPSRGGRRASQLAHHRASVVGVDASARRRRSVAPEPPADSPQHQQAVAAIEVPMPEAEAQRARPPRTPLDPKVLKKIEQSLEKYEQASWAALLREESETKRRIFAHFAAEPESWELSAHEFHKMLTRWQELARWQLPGEIRPGDSLAALEYFMRRDHESRGRPPVPEAQDEAQPADDADVATEREEAKLGYHVWLDILGGKFRPEEHNTS